MRIINKKDLSFPENITKAVMGSSRIYPQQSTPAFGANQGRITKGGSMLPFGAIADHIRIDNSWPVYFPGTFDVEEEGVL